MKQKASAFTRKAHCGQTRRGGAPYYTHVHRVAARVQELTQDAHLVAAAYLHDTMEDCGVTPGELAELFGARVAELVQELTNNEALKNELGKEEYMVRKLSGLSADALLIKLCDTLDNMTETTRPEQARTYARIQLRLCSNICPQHGPRSTKNSATVSWHSTQKNSVPCKQTGGITCLPSGPLPG